MKTRISFVLCCSFVMGCLATSPVRADFLFVSNEGTGVVDKVAPNGTVSTFAKGFQGVESLTFYNNTVFFVASSTGAGQGTGSISELSSNGTITTLATGFSSPIGMAFDPSGNLFVADQNRMTIYKVTPSGAVSTFASGSNLWGVSFLTFDSQGNLYASTGHGVDKITPNGTLSVFASEGLSIPTGLAFDSKGDLFVANAADFKADTGFISEITPNGKVSRFASGFSIPEGLAFDSQGNLFVANMGTNIRNGTISEVTPDGTVSTFIGSGLNFPRGIAEIPDIATPAPSNATLLLTLGLCGLVGFAWRWRRRVESAAKWQGS